MNLIDCRLSSNLNFMITFKWRVTMMSMPQSLVIILSLGLIRHFCYSFILHTNSFFYPLKKCSVSLTLKRNWKSKKSTKINQLLKKIFKIDCNKAKIDLQGFTDPKSITERTLVMQMKSQNKYEKSHGIMYIIKKKRGILKCFCIF